MNPAGPPAGGQPRTSSGTARSQRSSNPDKQISQIEKSVTHLLVATKQLLETLTQWSRGQAQEEEVSDVYVRLGYEFNLACRAFNSIGVETADLGPVPDLLRSILEDTLSQPASPQSLDNYLPRIRDIIINLLHGLKRKQSKLRGKNGKDSTAPAQARPTAAPPRQASLVSAGSSDTGLGHMLEDLPSQPSSRQESIQSADGQAMQPANTSAMLPSSRPSISRSSARRDPQLQMSNSESSSLLSSATQSVTAMPSFPDASHHQQQTTPPPQPAPSQSSTLTPHIAFPHPPPPPPKQTDALTRLQRGGDLERRASRRFSAYQIQKHLGSSPIGVPVIPPAQNLPVINRGKEARESLSAVRSRTTYSQSRSRSLRQAEPSPSRSGNVRAPQRISEERDDPPNLSALELPKFPQSEPAVGEDSPTVKTPEEYHGTPKIGTDVEEPGMAATVSGPISPVPGELRLAASIDSHLAASAQPSESTTSPEAVPDTAAAAPQRNFREHATPPQLQVRTDSSPPQGKELTLFLQYKSKIKKFVLADGYEELTIPRLQLAFIEKFAWNTQHDGADLPDIYIQDPVSGVRHELEELSDVRDRCVLVLNVEALDEVKKHIDDGIGGLHKTLEGMRALLNGQGTMMQRFSDRQLQTSKEVARMSAVPIQPSRTPTLAPGTFTPTPAPQSSIQEVQNLRREIAVLRQTYSAMSSDFAASITDIKAKAANVKTVAAEAAQASYQGDAGRTHINEGKKTLSSDSESLVNRVDDLSDLVEELRKDVVTRGVRPLPRQLEDISKEIGQTAKHLTRVKEFMKREKPIWTKIWERELQMVMTERDDLTQQDELMADLDGDLEDITNVFKLVEEATKQQNLQAPGGPGVRNPPRGLAFDTDIDPHEAKTGVLDEVRALQPNHENRVEAIQRAEKARQKELANRKVGQFQREVEQFVEEGKLKKTGGAEEVERIRKLKDEQSRKENFERQQAREAERERKRQEEAAATAAAAATAGEPEKQGSTKAEEDENTSPDSEVAFQDATEDRDLTPTGDASPTPPTPPAKDNMDEQTADGASKLPAIHEGEQGLDWPTLARNTELPRDETVESEMKERNSDKRGSWWQPAIFSP